MNKKLNAKDWIKRSMELDNQIFFQTGTLPDIDFESLMESYASYKNDTFSENDGIKYYIVFTNNKQINLQTGHSFQTRLVVNKSVVNFIESICDCYYKNTMEKWYKLNSLEFQIIPYF